MRNRDYSHIGRNVKHAVKDAVHTGNLGEIGRAVGDSIDELADDVNEVFGSSPRQKQRRPDFYEQRGPFNNSASCGGNCPPPHSSQQQYNAQPPHSSQQQYNAQPPHSSRPNYTQPPRAPRPSYSPQPTRQKMAVNPAFRVSMPGSVSGVLMIIFGSLFGIPVVIADIIVSAVGISGFMPFSAFTTTSSILTAISAVFILMFTRGISLRRRVRRFERYREIIGSDSFFKIDELADTAGEPKDRVKKDLRLMISSGACPHGHIDRAATSFILDDKTYSEYLEAEKAYNAREKAAREEEEKERSDPKEAELSAVRKEGAECVRKIHELNDELPGKEISDKLDKLENVTARIFACVEKHPEKLADTRRFMRYYLPTTLKLVNSYKEFETQPVQGENIKNAKEEINRALDTINMAFGNLLDSLFANDALDISADISTLETMLKQEGLTGSDFHKNPDDIKLS